MESVTIYGKEQYVVAERKRLSDLLASVGADFGIGYGPLRMSISRLEGGLKKSISSVLRSGDRELGKKVELEIKEIVEIAAFSYSGAFLFDPNLNLETKDTFELLNKRDLQPVNETNLKGEGQVLEPTFLKSRVMEEVKDKLYKKPEEYPHQVIEQVFKVTQISLIYIPFYDLSLKYRDKEKKIRLNGMTGKIMPLS